MTRWLQGKLATAFEDWKAIVHAKREKYILLARAGARLKSALVAKAFCKWQGDYTLAKRGKKVLKQMLHRLLSVVWRTWCANTRGARRSRQESRLKLAQVELNAKEQAMRKQMEKSDEVQERIASLLARQRRTEGEQLRFRYSWKQWQLRWLWAKVMKVEKVIESKENQTTQVEANASKANERLRRQVTSLEAEIGVLKKSLTDAKHSLQRKHHDEATLRAQASAAKTDSVSESQRVTELMREVQTVKQALHNAETNGEAHKIALERATMVRVEEIRKLKEEIESYRCAPKPYGF